MRQKTLKRAVHGILLLDKPRGMSSNQALQIVKRLFAAKKAGHTGSLDPLADGMLPLCFGGATRLSEFLLTADKKYRVTMQLGIRTATGDSEGEILSQRQPPHLTAQALEKIFERFRGEIEQTPSMYSALKHKGQPLYQLARRGITIERKSRRLTIYALNLLNFSADTIEFDLHCSKGTYVRTLVDDMGELLGCGAHVTALRRLSVGGYDEADMIPLAALEAQSETGSVETLDSYLLPVHSAVAHWPSLTLAENTAFYLRQGNAVVVPHAPLSGWVQLSDKQGRFLGVGEILPDGKVAPRRLVGG